MLGNDRFSVLENDRFSVLENDRCPVACWRSFSSLMEAASAEDWGQEFSGIGRKMAHLFRCFCLLVMVIRWWFSCYVGGEWEWRT